MKMHAQTATDMQKQIVSGFGMGAGAVLVLALILLAVLGFIVGFDQAAWAASSKGERLMAGIALGAASGGGFALVADLVRQAMR